MSNQIFVYLIIGLFDAVMFKEELGEISLQFIAGKKNKKWFVYSDLIGVVLTVLLWPVVCILLLKHSFNDWK